jgi:FkbM family methyltransferase
MGAAVIQLLDYEPYPVGLYVTSDIERDVRIRSCAKEVETVSWIESLKPGVFYDCGANIGAYSFVAAANGHDVYSFEPPGLTYDRLWDNVILNHNLKVSPWAVLLGDANGKVRFSYSSLEPGAALHSLGEGENSMLLEMCRLDDYRRDRGLPAPDYLKLDTDGSELLILKGSTETLANVKSLQVEVEAEDPGATEVAHLLFDAGFALVRSTLHDWSGVSNVVFERYEAE